MPNMRFNPPPSWPVPPTDWSPPPGWEPDPAWGPAPVGWPLWVPEERSSWLRRHKVLAGIGGGATGVAALLIIIGAAGASAAEPGTSPMAARTTAAQAAPVVVATTAPAAVPTTVPAVADTTGPPVAETTEPDVAEPTEPPVAETTEAPEPSYAVPSKRNLKLSVKTKSQHCFGSAGCNVEYEVKAKIVGGVTFDPSITYEVTIETLGSDNGPRTDTFTITGDQYEPVDGYVSTASASTELTAVITSIEVG